MLKRAHEQGVLLQLYCWWVWWLGFVPPHFSYSASFCVLGIRVARGLCLCHVSLIFWLPGESMFGWFMHKNWIPYNRLHASQSRPEDCSTAVGWLDNGRLDQVRSFKMEDASGPASLRSAVAFVRKWACSLEKGLRTLTRLKLDMPFRLFKERLIRSRTLARMVSNQPKIGLGG